MVMACSQRICRCRCHPPLRCITINLLYRRYLWFMYHKCKLWYQYIRLHIIIVCIQTIMEWQIIKINFPSCKETKRPCRSPLVVHNNANNVEFYIAYIARFDWYLFLCLVVWYGVMWFRSYSIWLFLIYSDVAQGTYLCAQQLVYVFLLLVICSIFVRNRFTPHPLWYYLYVWLGLLVIWVSF